MKFREYLLNPKGSKFSVAWFFMVLKYTIVVKINIIIRFNKTY